MFLFRPFLILMSIAKMTNKLRYRDNSIYWKSTQKTAIEKVPYPPILLPCNMFLIVDKRFNKDSTPCVIRVNLVAVFYLPPPTVVSPLSQDNFVHFWGF